MDGNFLCPLCCWDHWSFLDEDGVFMPTELLARSLDVSAASFGESPVGAGSVSYATPVVLCRMDARVEGIYWAAVGVTLTRYPVRVELVGFLPRGSTTSVVGMVKQHWNTAAVTLREVSGDFKVKRLGGFCSPAPVPVGHFLPDLGSRAAYGRHVADVCRRLFGEHWQESDSRGIAHNNGSPSST
jgi:hypothetical protein